MKLIMMITFAVFTLANSACVKKDGGPVQCCDQREHDGSLHCCVGTNNSCSMSTAGFVNGRSSCYCDEYCKQAGDCCPDFESFNKTCGFDINECRRQDKGGCSHGCVNTLGSYRCTCPNGFQLNNGRTCQDINECRQRDKGGCSHGCVNTLGSYRCTCPNCFQLNNGRTCQAIRSPSGERRQTGTVFHIRKYISCILSVTHGQGDPLKYVKQGNCLNARFFDLQCQIRDVPRNCSFTVECNYQFVTLSKVSNWMCTYVHVVAVTPFCCDPICPVT